MEQNKSKQVVAGIDVASTELVTRISVDTKVRRHENSQNGIKQLLKELFKEGVTFVVLEHTGKHEQALLEVLWQAAMPAHCAHPKAAHNFAKALRANAKSDPIDAGILMEYGLRMDLLPTPRPAQEILDLQSIVTRRDDFNEMLVQEKNRLRAPALAAWKKRSILKHIKYLKTELAALEADMHKLVEKYPSLQAPLACLDEEYGVGFVSAATLYAHVPELGTMNRQRVAAIAGLAPFIRQSGKFQGQSKIYGGRTAARSALYMPALTIIRKKGHPLCDFYLRLRKANKPTNEALTAVMRKLLIRLNTRMKMLTLQTALA